MIASQHRIFVNGEVRTVAQGSTLPEVLRAERIDPQHARGVAVAVNEEVVRRQAWESITVQEDDRIEIVTANQGG